MTGLLRNDRFPRSNKYSPAWIMEHPYGAHALWLTEWLCERVALQPHMRILDLGCGKAKSSVFMAREYGVEVWATDLWTPATENRRRVEDADAEGRVFPIHADAHQLPFAGEFFDAVTSVDAYQYFGTDDLYLNYLAQFIRPGGTFAFVSAGLMQDFGADVPEHLRRFWTQDNWVLHTTEWWRHHLGRTGLVEVEQAEVVADGWRLWLEWAEALDAPDWYRQMLKDDAGRYLGYVGLTMKRVEGRPLAEYAWPSTLRSMSDGYERHALLRAETTDGS
jgi:cyclopropane fatty-acyl-phospholipid synthase-like methyltransferase